MIKVNNTQKVINSFGKYKDQVHKELRETVGAVANEIMTDAKNNARNVGVYDNGDLIQNIRASAALKNKGLTWIVGAYMPYSAYHEFGTGGLVNIPAEWSAMARQFKGKGIKQVNIYPRPFMYPAYIKGKQTLRNDVNDTIKRLTKKFNIG